MPPSIATFATLAGILYLLWRDTVHGEARSPALWIPVLWLGITSSRFVSQWMNLGSWGGNVAEADGSPVDAAFFASMIALGAMVLYRRRIRVIEIVRSNGWIVAVFAYALLSVLWADDATLAIKRWIKTLGHPIIALILLTEPDPKAAIRTVFKRVGFILLPLSVLFIKYLPEYGRGYDLWTGIATNRGAALTKTDLGYLCMVLGVMYVWNLLSVKRIVDDRARRIEIGLTVVFLGMLFWLLSMANSKTSLVTMMLGIAVMLLLGTRMVSTRNFGLFVIVTGSIAYGLESAFDLYETIVAMLGKDPSLTDRTEVWADVIALQQRPLFGYGFESFWLGERLEAMWRKWWWLPTQAHNGYIETYLNLGWVGCGLLALLVLSTFRRITRQFETDFEFARLRMGFLFAIVLFNYTEAGFKGVHMIWTLFHIIAMEPPRRTETLARPVPMRA